MFRHGIVVCFILLILTGSLPAFEGMAKIQKVDPEKGILVLQVGDKERVVKADKGIKVLDAQGKELAGGLKSKNLTPGILERLLVNRKTARQSSRPSGWRKGELDGPATPRKRIPLASSRSATCRPGTGTREKTAVFTAAERTNRREHTKGRPKRKRGVSPLWMRTADPRSRARSYSFPSACRIPQPCLSRSRNRQIVTRNSRRRS